MQSAAFFTCPRHYLPGDAVYWQHAAVQLWLLYNAYPTGCACACVHRAQQRYAAICVLGVHSTPAATPRRCGGHMGSVWQCHYVVATYASMSQVYSVHTQCILLVTEHNDGAIMSRLIHSAQTHPQYKIRSTHLTSET